uniref:amino acid ABC transporter permease n=1 Tax=Thermohahella caldifontis TaxID=3142973 RepID=UPI003F74888B
MQSDPQQQVKPVKTGKWWNDPKIRGIFYQALAALAVAGFIWYLANNALTNMEKRGITTGFDFLSQPAGFGILQTLIDYTEADTYGKTFVVGLLNTVLVSVIGIILATILGFIMGIARLSHNWLIQKIATAYVEIFRNVPLLLQIFFWYFAVLQALPGARNSISIGEAAFLSVRGLYIPRPITEDGFGWVTAAFVLAIILVITYVRWDHKHQAETGQILPVFWPSVAVLIGLPLITYWIMGSPLHWEYPELKRFNFAGGIRVIPEFMALLMALVIYTGTYIAETVRSGIEAVSHGQTEAALALGFTNSQRLRLIVVPQALRVIIPPLTNQYLNLTKNSSLATAIGYPDLVSVFAGTTLNQTGQAVEIILMTMSVYLTLSLTTSAFMNWYNKRIALVER